MRTYRRLLRWVGFVQIILIILLSAGCAFNKNNGNVKIQKGLASWYGPKFHGKMTASGERYNMNKLTAAHRTIPFGTRVKVTHLKTKRSVVVRINDRGPFVKGRIIDLSRKAAKKIGLIEEGVARVIIEILD